MADVPRSTVAALALGLAVGGVGGASWPRATTTGAHEAVVMMVGTDTLRWAASVRTDSILGVVPGYGFFCRARGRSMAFLRLYRGNSLAQITADSVSTWCVIPGSVEADSLAFDWSTARPVKICLVPTDTLAAYGIVMKGILSRHDDSIVQSHCVTTMEAP